MIIIGARITKSNSVHTLIFNENNIYTKTKEGFGKYYEYRFHWSIKETVRWIEFELADGFKLFDVDLSKLCPVFPNFSQVKFTCSHPSKYLLPSKTKGYKGFWQELEFGEHTFEYTKITLLDCKLYMLSENGPKYLECEKAEISMDSLPGATELVGNVWIIYQYQHIRLQNFRLYDGKPEETKVIESIAETCRKAKYTPSIFFRPQDVYEYTGWVNYLHPFLNVSKMKKANLIMDTDKDIPEDMLENIDNSFKVIKDVEISIQVLGEGIDTDLLNCGFTLLDKNSLVRIGITHLYDDENMEHAEQLMLISPQCKTVYVLNQNNLM